MPAILLNKWLWIGLALAGLSIAVWLQTQRLEASQKAEKAAIERAAQWESNFHTAQQVNADNLKTIAALQQEQAKANQAASDQIAKYNRLGAAYEKIKRSTDTSSLSDSWKYVFDSLRDIETSAPGNR